MARESTGVGGALDNELEGNSASSEWRFPNRTTQAPVFPAHLPRESQKHPGPSLYSAARSAAEGEP